MSNFTMAKDPNNRVSTSQTVRAFKGIFSQISANTSLNVITTDDININSSNNICLNASGEIKLNASSNIKINSGGDIVLNASGDIVLNAGDDITLNGSNIIINSSNTIVFNSSGEITLNGSSVIINNAIINGSSGDLITNSSLVVVAQFTGAATTSGTLIFNKIGNVVNMTFEELLVTSSSSGVLISASNTIPANFRPPVHQSYVVIIQDSSARASGVLDINFNANGDIRLAADVTGALFTGGVTIGLDANTTVSWIVY